MVIYITYKFNRSIN